MPCISVDTFLGKEGGIQVLAGLALSSQIVGSLRIHSWQITVLSILEWSTRKVFHWGWLHQISPDFSIFIDTCKSILELGMPRISMDTFLGKKGGIQVLAGLVLPGQIVGSLLRIHGSQSILEKYGEKRV
jgi:hypothetical protein